MILHLLPGDSTVCSFQDSGIEGEIAVCREALIDGDVSGETLPEFWENRARYFAREYPDAGQDYHEKVVREFARLTAALQSGAEINLWFEYELFCQANMWFCLSLMTESTGDIFRVAPVVLSDEKVWDGFSSLTTDDLKKCLAARVKMSRKDIATGACLWSAYRTGHDEELERLSTLESPAFPKLREVCVAAVAKESRPREILSEIVRGGAVEFDKIFGEFKARAGEYGYGDAQVKKIWQSLHV